MRQEDSGVHVTVSPSADGMRSQDCKITSPPIPPKYRHMLGGNVCLLRTSLYEPSMLEECGAMFTKISMKENVTQ